MTQTPLLRMAASDSMSPPSGHQPPTNFVFESQILLLSRVDFPSMMDQQALVSSIAALYDHMDAQTAVVDMYRSFDEALPEQMARNVRLECKLQSLQDIAPPLSEFILRRYERLQD